MHGSILKNIKIQYYTKLTCRYQTINYSTFVRDEDFDFNFEDFCWILIFLRMDSCIKPDFETFFNNDAFGTDQYFSSYLPKKIKFCYLVKVKFCYLASSVKNTSIDC